MAKPDFLTQGEAARLFPVLSTTSKEGRTTSVFLACLKLVDEFGASLLNSVGQRAGVRSKLEAYTEVVFKEEKSQSKDRPDGLLILKSGSKRWSALIESKVGNNQITHEQVERYRQIAKSHGLDCVITISNQFATTPQNHPVQEIRKSRSKIPVFHWSWMYIRTCAELLIRNDEVEDSDQNIILSELLRFLTHESAGVKGFDRMPPEWGELNRQISAGAKVPAKSEEAITVLDAWHQETRDLSLILSRETETNVSQRLSRKASNDPSERLKSELLILRENHQLKVSLDIPNAAAPLDVLADINRRTIEVGMTLRAPEDRVSSKARLNWLLRQVKADKTDEIFVKMTWPGRSEDTMYPFDDLKAQPDLCEKDKAGLQVVGFHIYLSKRLGAKFTQQTNFISELEAAVPEYYRNVGQNLLAWVKPAPKIRDTNTEANEEVVSEG